MEEERTAILQRRSTKEGTYVIAATSASSEHESNGEMESTDDDCLGRGHGHAKNCSFVDREVSGAKSGVITSCKIGSGTQRSWSNRKDESS